MRGDQRAYDRGSTIFSPDGRLYQVEYARQAVTQGAPCVGVRTADGVVLAAHQRRRSPLVAADGVEKLHLVDDHVAAASAGHAADARRLVEVARRTAQTERLRYGEPAAVEALSTAVADHVQEHTQTGGTRPYGTALLVAGYDGAPRLFETDPSGARTEWRAAAVGRDASEVTAFFEDEYESGLAVGAGVELALAGLHHATGGDLSLATVEVGTVDERGYAPVADDDVRTALEAAGS